VSRAAAALAVMIAAGAMHHGDPRAALAGLIAGFVAVLALSLSPDRTGLAVGGFFVGAGILSWTYTSRPLVVWALLLVEGLVFAWWSRPWIAWLRPAGRLGTAWLGLAYWLLGIVGAALVGHVGVAAERTAYAGVFGLAVLGVLARSRSRDLSTGVAAAFGFALAALLFAGAGNLFRATHPVPDNDWGTGLEHRFWGGPGLLYHPNSMAGVAVLLAIRVGPDRAFAAWQRVSVVALAGFVVAVTNSRTGFVFLLAAAVAHAVVSVARRSASTPERIVPFAVLAAVLVATHGTAFLGQARYAEGGVTSGRLDTWKQVARDWEHAGWAEKTFGDASDARATVHRESSGDGIELTVDNAAVGALRRGGALGELAFLVGLFLLVRHALRPGARIWFTVAVLASLPTVATTEWLLGTTGGTLWILAVAGEVTHSGSPVPSPRCSPAGTPC